MLVKLQLCCSWAQPPNQPGNKIRPTQQGLAGAPPLAVPSQAFNPFPIVELGSRNETKYDESSDWHDKLNIWVALVIGD